MKSNLFCLLATLFFQITCFGTTNLSGRWQIKCKDGLIKEQLIQGDFVKSTEKFYADRDCQKISFIFETSGVITFTAEQPAWIDFRYEKVAISVFNPIALDDLNSRKVCGFDDWETGTAKDITGLRCALFNIHKETQIPRAGDMKYGIFNRENNQLYYGQMTPELDGSTEQRRPQVLGTEFYVLNEAN